MMDIPNLGDAETVTDAVRTKTKTLVPWLPTPLECPGCGAYMDATREYDRQQAAFYPMGKAPAWSCDDCDIQLRRESY